jgi:hypothetical protein
MYLSICKKKKKNNQLEESFMTSQWRKRASIHSLALFVVRSPRNGLCQALEFVSLYRGDKIGNTCINMRQWLEYQKVWVMSFVFVFWIVWQENHIPWASMYCILRGSTPDLLKIFSNSLICWISAGAVIGEFSCPSWLQAVTMVPQILSSSRIAYRHVKKKIYIYYFHLTKEYNVSWWSSVLVITCYLRMDYNFLADYTI